jgi:hypothetical protein
MLEGSMVPVEVVVVELWGELFVSFKRVLVVSGVGLLAERGVKESFGLSVGPLLGLAKRVQRIDI